MTQNKSHKSINMVGVCHKCVEQAITTTTLTTTDARASIIVAAIETLNNLSEVSICVYNLGYSH
jgi:hypothetical protein